jgi:hypothetical protein
MKSKTIALSLGLILAAEAWLKRTLHAGGFCLVFWSSRGNDKMI